VKKQKLEVVGWREIKVWAAVREVVGKGVGVHVAENPVVQGLVGWEAEAEADGQPDGLDEKVGQSHPGELRVSPHLLEPTPSHPSSSLSLSVPVCVR
jgi:hypothetical protein